MDRNEYKETVKLIKKMLKLRRYYYGGTSNTSSAAAYENLSTKERQSVSNRDSGQTDIQKISECETVILDKLEYLLRAGYSKKEIQRSFVFMSSYNTGVVDVFIDMIISKLKSESEKNDRDSN